MNGFVFGGEDTKLLVGKLLSSDGVGFRMHTRVPAEQLKTLSENPGTDGKLACEMMKQLDREQVIKLSNLLLDYLRDEGKESDG